LFHEKGHILLDHNSNEWYDVSVVKDLMTKLRKSTRHVYEAASQVLNVCADCEVHTKLLGNDYEEMEIALSRLMKRRTKGSYWPTPEAYGFEPSKDAAFYLGSFVRDWDFARKIFEKRYPRFFV
jgi:hypothetical protein